MRATMFDPRPEMRMATRLRVIERLRSRTGGCGPAYGGIAARAMPAGHGVRRLARRLRRSISITGLVSRFRSSQSLSPLGSELRNRGTLEIYDSSAALNPKFATGLAVIVVRTSGSRH